MYIDERYASVEDFFNFKEDDTIAIISTIKYSQNKVIKWSEQSFLQRMSKQETEP